MIFTKNIKASIYVADGELTFEFRRPSNKDRNALIAAQLEAKGEGAERLNAIDEQRIRFYDNFIEALYVERKSGREDLTDEEGKKLGPKDISDDVKCDAVQSLFERNRVLPKNA